MRLTPKNKITKASLGGKKFLYNPSSLSDSSSVTYNEIRGAGMSYPVLTYGGGEQRFVVIEIYLNDKAKVGITKEFIAHLNTYMPKARSKGYQFSSPKNLVFAFGWFVKTCKLVSMDTDYTAFSPKLDPIEATVTVTLAIIQ